MTTDRTVWVCAICERPEGGGHVEGCLYDPPTTGAGGADDLERDIWWEGWWLGATCGAAVTGLVLTVVNAVIR